MAIDAREYYSQYRAKNRERIRQQALEWYYRNREKSLEYGRRYRAEHPDETREKSRRAGAKYRKQQPERVREIKRRNYQKHAVKNRERVVEYNRKYRAEHKDQRREYAKQYRKQRRAQVPEVRLLGNLRTKIRLALKSDGAMKAERTSELLGCTPSELRVHFESQFRHGMSWETYGRKGWHIDHIRPCASFDLTKSSERRTCFHYSNLQPLWAEDNLKKGKKVA